MQSKIYIEIGTFIQQYNEIQDDAFRFILKKELKENLLRLSNKYNLIIFTIYDLNEIKEWLKKYHLNNYFSDYYNYSLEKILEDNSIPYYVMNINLIELNR